MDILNIKIPADVPKEMRDEYVENYTIITKNTRHLLLYVCDHKIEHMNNDFYKEVENPQRLFDLYDLCKKDIGAFATHPGLIARYAHNYQDLNYFAKLNGKTNLIPKKAMDPMSAQLWTVDDILFLKKQGISIRGIGYTVYLGSKYERYMLQEAAHIITAAHHHGLITCLWMYPRGKYIKNERDLALISGACGVAQSLGSDFAKIKYPQKKKFHCIFDNTSCTMQTPPQVAGNTQIIISGGEPGAEYSDTELLNNTWEQIHLWGYAGRAIGRFIFQKSLPQAQILVKALGKIIYKDLDAKMVVAQYLADKNALQ